MSRRFAAPFPSPSAASERVRMRSACAALSVSAPVFSTAQARAAREGARRAVKGVAPFQARALARCELPQPMTHCAFRECCGAAVPSSGDP